jgi:uncharacterized protein (UPF0212 family)
MKFTRCPRCGNHEKGFTIYKCKKCERFYCYRSGFFSNDGCGTGSNCPNCGESLDAGFFSSSFEAVGETE